MDSGLLEGFLRMRPGVSNLQNPSTLVQYTDRSFLISDHESSLQQIPVQILVNSASAINMFSSVSPGMPAALVRTNLTPNNRVDIHVLTKNTDKRLEGKFFLCRTLAPPVKMTSIMTIAEDPKGQQAVRIALYNYSSSGDDFESLLQDLPVGTILAISNPWFKSTADGGFSIRCDNPADITVVSETVFNGTFPDLQWKGDIPKKWRHLIVLPPQNAVEWKNKGNKLFLAKKFHQAIQSYTEGLKLDDGNQLVKADMLANRAAAYLSLECFNKALEDSESVLKIQSNHLKGIYRKAKSLCGLQRFSDATCFLDDNISKSCTDENKSFSDLINKVRILEQQQITGEYNIPQLFENGPVYQDDFADFTGPVKVETISGKGRGLVATEVIQPGQLVIASKAFAIIFPDQDNPNLVEMNLNFETNYVNSATQRALVQRVSEKLMLEPELGNIVYKLYAGSKMPEFTNEMDRTNVDMKRIDGICSYNSFGSASLKDNSMVLNDFGDNSSSGLWILPSYINHSCWDCNCIWTTFGDVMLIRAFKKISPGEEILIPYVSPIDLYKKRNKVFKKHGFVCHCQLCKLDQDNSKWGRKRTRILEEIEVAFEKSNNNMMLTLMDKLDKLKLKNPALNPSIVIPLHHLAAYYFGPKIRQFRKSVELLTKCHTMTDNSPLMRFAVLSTINITSSLLEMKDVVAAKRWTEKMKQSLLIYYGTLEMAKVDAKITLKVMEAFGIFLD